MRPSVLLIILIPFLVACVPLLSAETRVTFYADENWEARVALLVAREQAQLAAAQLEQGLDEFVAQQRADGIQTEWARQNPDADGNIPYVITAGGQGLDQLNAAFFGNQALLYIDEGSGFIVFRHDPGSAVVGIIKQTFSLAGGSIISSNGLQTDGSIVTWANPTQPMEAILTPASRYPWLPYTLIGAGAVLLAVAAFGLVNSLRSQKSSIPSPVGPLQETNKAGTTGVVGASSIPSPVEPMQETVPDRILESELSPAESSAPVTSSEPLRVPASSEQSFCHNCGQALEAEAQFCPQCGVARRVP